MSDVYLGNPNLKKANTTIKSLQKQNRLRSLLSVNVYEDPVYFAKNYLIKIVTLDHGLETIQDV